MSDYRFSDEATSFEALFHRMSSRIRVAMPGNIGKFDPATQRASATPGIKMKQIIDGKAEYLDMPEILNAPVVFPFMGIPLTKVELCFVINHFVQCRWPNEHGALQ